MIVAAQVGGCYNVCKLSVCQCDKVGKHDSFRYYLCGEMVILVTIYFINYINLYYDSFCI